MEKLPKIAFFTNVAPHYRKEIWEILLQEKEWDLHIFFGDNCPKDPQPIRQIDVRHKPYRGHCHSVKNLYRQGTLIWQKGVLQGFSRWDTIILLGQVGILSNWMLALLGRLTGKRVFTWSHGVYGNESRAKRLLKKLFHGLAHEHLLYGEYAKEQMEEMGFRREHVHVVYNSLHYNEQRKLRRESVKPCFYREQSFFQDNTLPTLIFTGRLTKVKRLDLIFQAMEELEQRYQQRVNLVVVGDGPERKALARKAEKLKGRVHFYGPCYDEVQLGVLIANAALCVSPGNVGLTAIHAMSFGTPVCSHDTFEEQMPEFEAIVPGKTGFFFSLSANNLAEKLHDWLQKEGGNREQIRKACYSIIDRRFNPYAQLEVLKKALLKTKQVV
ncbi:MAG: glycosyltransferase family 4 protein [Nitritalea sp.]